MSIAFLFACSHDASLGTVARLYGLEFAFTIGTRPSKEACSLGVLLGYSQAIVQSFKACRMASQGILL
jgi:hypothetical protein